MVKKIALFFLVVIALAVVGVFAWSSIKTSQAVDLGVVYSDEALQSFNDKIGAKSSGIVAGGLPVGDSFSNAEFTSFLTVLAKERNLPIQSIQVRFHENSFEASAVAQKFVFIKGDVYIKGSIQVKSSRKVRVDIQELQSKTIPISAEMKEAIEQKLNGAIQYLFDQYGPDERFLRIQKLQLKEDQLVVGGILPLEFFLDSKIRF